MNHILTCAQVLLCVWVEGCEVWCTLGTSMAWGLQSSPVLTADGPAKGGIEETDTSEGLPYTVSLHLQKGDEGW